jgi:hypothetical protein
VLVRQLVVGDPEVGATNVQGIAAPALLPAQDRGTACVSTTWLVRLPQRHLDRPC